MPWIWEIRANNQCQLGSLRTAVGITLLTVTSLVFAVADSTAQKPSVYADARLRQWSALIEQGLQDEALKSIEADILSTKRHPFATDAWLTLQQHKGNLKSAIDTASPELRSALGVSATIALLDEEASSSSMATLFPPDQADKVDDVFALYRLTWNATDRMADYEGALKYVLAAEKLVPDDFRAAWLAENIADNNLQARQALRSLLAPGSALGETPFGKFERAVTSDLQMGDDDRLQAVNAWLQNVPDDAAALRYRANIFIKLKKHVEALNDLLRGHDLYAFRPGWTSIGSVLYALGRDAEAHEIFTRYARYFAPDPANVSAMLSEADALADLKMSDKAIAVLTEAIKSVSNDSTLYLKRAEVERNSEDYGAWIEDIISAEKYTKTPSQRIDLMKEYGRKCCRLRRLGPLLRQIAGENQQLPLSYYQTAHWLYTAQGNLHDDLQLTEEGVNRFPAASPMMLARAQALAGTGHFSEAMAMLETLWKHTLPDAESAETLAGILDAQGTSDEDIKKNLTALINKFPQVNLGFGAVIYYRRFQDANAYQQSSSKTNAEPTITSFPNSPLSLIPTLHTTSSELQYNFALSNDGEELVDTIQNGESADSELRFWDPRTGLETAALPLNEISVDEILLNPSGTLAALMDRNKRKIDIVDLSTRSRISRISGFAKRTVSTQWADDGRLLVLTQDNSEGTHSYSLSSFDIIQRKLQWNVDGFLGSGSAYSQYLVANPNLIMVTSWDGAALYSNAGERIDWLDGSAFVLLKDKIRSYSAYLGSVVTYSVGDSQIAETSRISISHSSQPDYLFFQGDPISPDGEHIAVVRQHGPPFVSNEDFPVLNIDCLDVETGQTRSVAPYEPRNGEHWQGLKWIDSDLLRLISQNYGSGDKANSKDLIYSVRQAVPVLDRRIDAVAGKTAIVGREIQRMDDFTVVSHSPVSKIISLAVTPDAHSLGALTLSNGKDPQTGTIRAGSGGTSMSLHDPALGDDRTVTIDLHSEELTTQSVPHDDFGRHIYLDSKGREVSLAPGPPYSMWLVNDGSKIVGSYGGKLTDRPEETGNLIPLYTNVSQDGTIALTIQARVVTAWSLSGHPAQLWKYDAGSQVSAASMKPDVHTLAVATWTDENKRHKSQLFLVDMADGSRSTLEESTLEESPCPDDDSLCNFAPNHIFDLRYSEDGHYLFGLSGWPAKVNTTVSGRPGEFGGLVVWDIKSHRRIFDTFSRHQVNEFTQTKDRSHVIIVSNIENATVWSMPEGKLERELPGTSGAVSVQAAPDGTTVFIDLGNRIEIWNAATGEPRGAIYLFADKSWAVIDAENRFDSSNHGDNPNLYWVVGKEPIALSQLKTRYYDYGLLSKMVGLNHEPLRDVTNFSQVELFPDAAAKLTDGASGKLEISLINRGGGIGRVQVLVNSKEYLSDARSDLAIARSPEGRIDVDLSKAPSLKPGEPNNVEIITWNEQGYISSRGFPVVWTPPGKKDEHKPELYAIVVGTAEYASAELHLKYSAKDAEDFAHALSLAGERFLGHGSVHLTLLNSGATTPADKPKRDNIKRAFESAQKARPEDILVVYLSGHGVSLTQGTDTYLYLTADATQDFASDPAVRAAGSISSEDLVEWTKKIPALKQVMVLDTCAAGAASGDFAEKKQISGDEVRALDRLQVRTGFHVLMGSAADAVSYEATQYRQGLLTYSLLRGMQGAALRDGEFVDVSQLFQYAADSVPELAKSIGGVQRPLVEAPNGTSFDIGEMTSIERSQIQLPSPSPLVLRASFIDRDRSFDKLGLTSMITKRLHDFGEGTPRGKPLVFLDVDEMPEAYRPSGTYTQQGDRVQVHVVLQKGDSPIADFIVEGTVSAREVLADAIAQKVEDAMK